MADQRFHTEITASASQFNAEMDAAAQRAITDAQRMQSSWREGFYQMGQNAAGMSKQMNSQFDGVRKMIESFRGPLAILATMIAGATFLNKFASDASKATVETEKLASTLGTSTQEASALKIALDDIGVETETYTGMVSKMMVKLREGEERFNALGVKTRGANGDLLSTDQIVQNALQALLKFREGTDRNLAATEFFGRGWQEVNRVMKLTPEVMEAARQKARELELEIGPEGVASAEHYKSAMNDLGDVYGALKNRIGQALMPVLSDLAEWLSSRGPAAVTVMRGVMGGFLSVWYGLANVITVVGQLVKAFLYNVTEPMVGFGEAMGLALSGNFAAAGERLRQIVPNVKAAWENAFEETLKSSDKTRARLQALFDPNAEQGQGSGPKSGGNRKYTPELKGSRLSQFEAELAERRDAYDKEQMLAGTFQQFTKQMERDFWKNILDTQKLNKEEQAGVSKKYYAVERDLRKDAFEREIEDIKSRIEAFKQGSVERIQLAGESAAKIGEKYGLESKEYRQAVAEMSKLARERKDQMDKLEDLSIERTRQYQISRVDLERQNLDTLESLGIIKAKEKLARLKELKEIEYQIELKAAQDRAELLKGDAVAYKQAMDRIKQLAEKHGIDQAQIDGQIAQEKKKTLDTWIDPVTQAMNGMVNGVLQGTQTMQQMLANALRNIALSYANTLLKMGADWLKAEILKTQATVAGTSARTAAESAGATASTGFTLGSAVKTIGAKAWEAASSVYASIAQIPVVGPFLAPAMAIAAAATVLGFVGKIASAAGGFDVPTGVNPLVQMHEEEMVLPKDIANPLRDQLATGGSGNIINFNIKTQDSKDMMRGLRTGGALRKALEELHRKGVF